MKKILALILSTLMIASAFAGFAVSAEDEIVPAKLFDGAALNPTNGPWGIAGEYNYNEGFIRYTWFNQGGWDPYFWLYHQDLPNFAAGDYMVVMYRTETEGLTAEPHMGNGGLGSSNAIWEFDEADGEWHKAIVYLPDAITNGMYNAETNEISHIRLDLIMGEDAEANPDGWLDIEYIAFFDSEDDAYDYEHVLPVDPDVAAGGSYKTYDFTTATDLSQLMGEYFEMSAELIDGVLRITANGADPYAKLLTDGADTLGITGAQARYILVKYKTSTTVANPQIKFFANVPGVGNWGTPGTMTNGDNLTADGNWHYVMVDTSGAWGTNGGTLTAFRMDALDAANVGDTIDVASVQFFTTSDWVKSFITAAAATDAAAEELAVAQGWMTVTPPDESETTPDESETLPDESETTPDESETTPDESVTTPDESVTTPDESVTTPATEESTPATEESTPATEESAPATEESAPATDDETDAEETTTGEAEETTAPAAAETHAGDESTDAPEAAGCKGVIASASILAVAVMAAGVVVCKKKED